MTRIDEVIAERDRARSLAATLEAENATLLATIHEMQDAAIASALIAAKAIVTVEAHE